MINLVIILFSLINPIILILNSKSPYDYSSYKYVSKNKNLSTIRIISNSSDESSVYITEKPENPYLLFQVEIHKILGNSTNVEDSELYGVNSACLIQGGSLKMKYVHITIKNVNGSAAIFSTNEGIAEMKSTAIYSDALSFSSGICTSFLGRIKANNLWGHTSGYSSPFILLRDGGSIDCYECSINTNGENSDLVQSKGYKSGYVYLYRSGGTAKKSKICSISGRASFIIDYRSNLKCSANPIKSDIDQSAIMLYQTRGKSNFEPKFSCSYSTLEIMDSSYYYSTAPMFFVTNTFAKIDLKDCEINYGSNVFINIRATEEWGIKGSNSGDVVLSLTEQNIEGDFVVDENSTLQINLVKSHIKGTINPSNTVKSLIITLDNDSTITITGNSYCTTINNEMKSGKNLINGSFSWIISKPIDPVDSTDPVDTVDPAIDNKTNGILKSNFIILNLIVSVILLE